MGGALLEHVCPESRIIRIRAYGASAVLLKYSSHYSNHLRM
uniref:Uncharacterized protein n=1 Tax=Anguilla anguilla TaxID=7936 RepID=A0A0E9RJ86_ANGAN